MEIWGIAFGFCLLCWWKMVSAITTLRFGKREKWAVWKESILKLLQGAPRSMYLLKSEIAEEKNPTKLRQKSSSFSESRTTRSCAEVFTLCLPCSAFHRHRWFHAVRLQCLISTKPGSPDWGNTTKGQGKAAQSLLSQTSQQELTCVHRRKAEEQLLQMH